MYLTLTVIGLFIIFVIVTDLGPQHSGNRIWRALQNTRRLMDHIFSFLFAVGVAISCVIALAAGIYNWLTGGGTSTLVTGAILIIILAICFFSLRSNRESFRRGERCECCGDCSKCKIKCTTNEKYYGIQRHKPR